MPSIFDRESGRRWPRSQKFILSAQGTDAEAKYREMITASRSESGRGSFDAARIAWAQPLKVQPGDGLFLGELAGGPRTLEELTRALEDCGQNRREIKAGLERLMDAQLIQVEAPPAPAPPTHNTWR